MYYLGGKDFLEDTKNFRTKLGDWKFSTDFQGDVKVSLDPY